MYVSRNALEVMLIDDEAEIYAQHFQAMLHPVRVHPHTLESFYKLMRDFKDDDNNPNYSYPFGHALIFDGSYAQISKGRKFNAPTACKDFLKMFPEYSGSAVVTVDTDHKRRASQIAPELYEQYTQIPQGAELECDKTIQNASYNTQRERLKHANQDPQKRDTKINAITKYLLAKAKELGLPTGIQMQSGDVRQEIIDIASDALKGAAEMISQMEYTQDLFAVIACYQPTTEEERRIILLAQRAELDISQFNHGYKQGLSVMDIIVQASLKKDKENN